jgi:hypothetical protein
LVGNRFLDSDCASGFVPVKGTQAMEFAVPEWENRLTVSALITPA